MTKDDALTTLTKISDELKGIDEADLTTAEKNILKHLKNVGIPK